jgi:hypothetical protein
MRFVGGKAEGGKKACDLAKFGISRSAILLVATKIFILTPLEMFDIHLIFNFVHVTSQTRQPNVLSLYVGEQRSR